MNQGDKVSVLRFLGMCRASEPGQGVKVYHQGPTSLSWDDIIKEVMNETPFGQGYVENLASAARSKGKTVEAFLNA